MKKLTAREFDRLIADYEKYVEEAQKAAKA